jgi:L-alanine-DL-glutamate epimerase-like enolase superfamily enzyme
MDQSTMKLTAELWSKTWPMTEPFVIARGVQTAQPTLQVQLSSPDGAEGRGEACGVPYAGETPQTMAEQIEAVREALGGGINRRELLDLLPPGGARCGLDSALWDLETKRGDCSDPFRACGLQPRPVISARTIGIRSLAAYEVTARSLEKYPLLKIKVNADDPVAAVEAVHRGAPQARLIVDANQSWSVEMLKKVAPRLMSLGVVLLEQPIAVGSETGLDGYRSPVPLCADELINDVRDLAHARGRFQLINIKLDKCGGLTAGMALADAALAAGFKLMVGCMAGSSLSMAPAMVLAQRCEFADLDGPMLQAEDCEHGLIYVNGVVREPHNPKLWG